MVVALCNTGWWSVIEHGCVFLRFLETGFLDTFCFCFLAVAEMFWVFFCGGCHSLALVYLKGGFLTRGGPGLGLFLFLFV